MDEVTQAVARQYEAYVYPPPRDVIAGGSLLGGDPSEYWPLLWPEGRPATPLRILSAGCGTTQAALLAYRNRDAQVIGIDLSDASLNYQRELQTKYDLTNLRLFKGDLRDSAELGQFDLIFCTGVLHHLAKPEEGVLALKKALAPGGVMKLMLYGATLRAGVYMMQDVFRRLQVEQSPEGVALVRSALDLLPSRHFARLYMDHAGELDDDSALVDTFLHPQDRAYTVPQVLKLVRDCGLWFQGWADGISYAPDAFFRPDTPFAQALAKAPAPTQWAIMEMMNLSHGVHAFLVRAAPGPVISFDAPRWHALIPHRAPGVRMVEKAQINPERNAKLARGALAFALTPAESILFESIDGERAIGTLLAQSAFAAHEPAAREAFARVFFSRMQRHSHLMFSLV